MNSHRSIVRRHYEPVATSATQPSLIVSRTKPDRPTRPVGRSVGRRSRRTIENEGLENGRPDSGAGVTTGLGGATSRRSSTACRPPILPFFQLRYLVRYFPILRFQRFGCRHGAGCNPLSRRRCQRRAYNTAQAASRRLISCPRRHSPPFNDRILRARSGGHS